MKKYKNRYMATCLPGMEPVVTDEVNGALKNINNISQSRGKVIFDCMPDFVNYSMLKCADNIYKLLCTFPVGLYKADLPRIGPYITSIDFNEGSKTPARVIVSASRSGKHTYSRYDLANHVGSILISTGKFIQGDSANHDLAVRVDVADENCVVYKQLTSPEMRFRGRNFLSAPGGLRPSAAHCLVRLSNPKSNDIFYDPFCGAGTIPYERSFYKRKRIYASDINNEVVEIAKANLKQSAIVFQADAVSTKMKDNGVNTVVTNLPWGKQVKIDDIFILYSAFFNELKRILTPDGKAVILTDQTTAVFSICEKLNLNCSTITELSLHGLHPAVLLIKR